MATESRQIPFPYAPLSDVSHKFHKSPSRFTALVGGFRSGKTTAACAEGIALSLEFPKNCGAVCRKTFGELDRSTRLVFQDMCPPELIAKPYSTSDHTIHFVNGSRVIFFPLDEREKVKSLTVGWFLIDEASEVEEEMFEFMRGRLSLPNVRHRGMVVSNPTPTTHWFYKMFGAEQRANHVCFRMDTYDNPHLPPEYLADLEANYSREMVDRFLKGHWGFSPGGGRVYEEFNYDIHVRPQRFNAAAPLLVGWDFGYVHPAIVVAQLDDQDRLHVLREYMGSRVLVDTFGHQVNTLIKQQFSGTPSQEHYGDPHGKATAAGGQSDKSAIQILSDSCNFNVQTRSGYPLADSLSLVRRKLSQLIGGRPAIEVDPSCRITIEGLAGGYICKKAVDGVILKDEPKDDGYYEHCQDALRFLILGKFVGEIRGLKRDPKPLPIYRPSFAGTSY